MGVHLVEWRNCPFITPKPRSYNNKMSSSTDLWNSRTGRPNAYRSDPPTPLSSDPPNHIQNIKPPSEVFPEHAGLVKYLLCFEGLYIHQWP